MLLRGGLRAIHELLLRYYYLSTTTSTFLSWEVIYGYIETKHKKLKTRHRVCVQESMERTAEALARATLYGGATKGATLLSPPRDWPNCFTANAALKKFLKTVKGKRARLIGPPPASVLAELGGLSFDSAVTPLEHAERVHNHLGWPIVTGVALYEREDTSDEFVAEEWHWNVHPSSMWIDLKPRTPSVEQLVLVEIARLPNTCAATPTGAPTSSSTIDTTAETCQLPHPINPRKPTLPLPPPTAPSTAAAAATTSTSVLDSSNLTKPRRKKERKDSLLGMWRHIDIRRKVQCKGEDGYTFTKNTWFPGTHGQVRMVLRADQTFEFEARRWGTVDGLREGPTEFAPRYEPELLAPLEYGDAGAAVLRVTGTWIQTQHSELHLQLQSVEELSNGTAVPPVNTAEIHYATGKRLGR